MISGYLITSILLTERHATGRIDLKTFYIRRARRLLPALLALLVVITLVAAIFLPERGRRRCGATSLAALTYVTNWFFIFGDKSYFESAGRPSLLQHLWSLAVEEQFYLIWPLLFVRRHEAARRAPSCFIAWCSPAPSPRPC